MRILVINTEESFTEYGIYYHTKPFLKKIIPHSGAELKLVLNPEEQGRFRKDIILSDLNKIGFNVKSITEICVQLGPIRKLISNGVFEANNWLKAEIIEDKEFYHPSHYALLSALEIASQINVPVYACDSVTADEMWPLARATGFPPIVRRGHCHSLTLRYNAYKFSEENQIDFDNASIVGVHMGKEISIVAFFRGKIVDVSSSFQDGPFSWDSSGGISLRKINDYIVKNFSEKVKKIDLSELTGLKSYDENKKWSNFLLKKNFDPQEEFLIQSMIYQIVKSVYSMISIFPEAKIDGFFAEGQLLENSFVLNAFLQKIEKIKKSGSVPVLVYPGKWDLESLAGNVVLINEGKLKIEKFE